MLEDALLEVAQEDKYGKTEIANAGEILRVLRGEVDAEAFEEWIRRAVIFLQSKKVLLSWLHGEDEDGELQAKERENRKGTSKENYAVIALRGLWEEWQNASTPHRRKPAEQLARKLDKTLLELSRETASVEKFMCCVRIATKGEGFMPEALPADAKSASGTIDLIRESRGAFETYEANATQAGSLKQADCKGAQVVAYSAESGAAGQGAAGDAEGSVRGSGVNCLTPHEAQTQRIYGVDGVYPAIPANSNGGQNRQAICFQASGDRDNPSISTSEKAYCIPANPMSDRGHAVCYAIEPGAAARLNTESRISENTCPTLRANAGDNQPAVCYAVRTRNTMANGWGVAENAYTLDTSEGQAVAYSVDCRNMNLTKEHGTLQAKENGEQSLNYMGAVCCPIDLIRESRGAFEVYDEDAKIGGSLKQSDNKGSQVVCYPIDSHQQDSRFKICEDGVCPTVPGQMGTGGNNGPMVLYTKQAIGHYCELKVASTQHASQYKSAEDLVVSYAKSPRKYIIRRLTPLECLRLQGLPDGWLDGVDGSDSAKYKMLGNGIAMPNAIYVVGCAVQLLQEGKHENEG